MKVQLIHPDAKLPTRGSQWSAGLDLYAVDDVDIPPCELRVIDIGIAVELPMNTVAIIKDRSSLGSKGFVTAAGVIDADYRGEWKVVIRNTRVDNSFRIVRGDRVAQAVIVPITYTTPIEGEVSETLRGEGGFGSTGK
jgi:dUTP pyrophosphatase